MNFSGTIRYKGPKLIFSDNYCYRNARSQFSEIASEKHKIMRPKKAYYDSPGK